MSDRGKIIPLRGKFESVDALLASAVGDANIQGVAIGFFRKDGSVRTVHINTSRADLAWLGAYWQSVSLER